MCGRWLTNAGVKSANKKTARKFKDENNVAMDEISSRNKYSRQEAFIHSSRGRAGGSNRYPALLAEFRQKRLRIQPLVIAEKMKQRISSFM